MADKETHRNRRRNIEADPVGGGTGKLEGSELLLVVLCSTPAGSAGLRHGQWSSPS